MVDGPPTDEVIRMKKDKLEHDDIVNNLEEKGYNQQQIYEAINQAEIKGGVGTNTSGDMKESMLSSEKEEEDIPIPSPSRVQEMETVSSQIQSNPQMQQFAQMQQPQYDYGNIQEIVESIVDEKWQQVVSNVGDISLWKSKTDDDISAIKQEILRTEGRIDNLQKSIIGKVDEYNRNISKVNTEIQVLEKVFQKIMQPFTENIKELSRLTKDLRVNTQQRSVRKSSTKKT